MSNHRFTKNALLLCQTAIIVVLAVCSGALLLQRHYNTQNAVPAGGKPPIESGSSRETDVTIPAVDWHYDLSGKKILLTDSTYGEIYLPVYESVPACSKQFDQIINRNGRKYYLENGEITSEFGIDISAHQKEIDWQAVKQSGVEFAILRVGYRTYGGGLLKPDERFFDNYAGATAVGIKVGAYFFSQAVNEEEAVEEAQFVTEQLKGLKLDYPVIYDWEIIYDDEARTDKIPCDVLTNCCLAFCDVVRSAGFHPMVYQNKRTTLFKLDLPRLQGIDFWLAEYSTEPTYYYDFNLWQYSCKGNIPGITGEVDLNISFQKYTATDAQ